MMPASEDGAIVRLGANRRLRGNNSNARKRLGPAAVTAASAPGSTTPLMLRSGNSLLIAGSARQSLYCTQ